MSDDRTTPNTSAIPRDDARQELDDLTVLTKANGAGLDDARLNLARTPDLDESKLGSLTTIHQGSRSAPAAGDLSGLMTGGGVDVATDVVTESGSGAGVTPAEVVLGAGEADDLADRPHMAGRTMAETRSAAAPKVAPAAQAAPEPTGGAREDVRDDAMGGAREDGGAAAGGTATAADLPSTPEPAGQPLVDTLPGEYEDEDDLSVIEPEPEAANAAPVILGATGTLGAEDSAISGQILAADADGDALAFELAPDGGPAHGTLTILADGSYTYLPAPDWSGTDTFTVQVSDGQGGVTTRTVEIEIASVNDAPMVTEITGTAAAEDHAVTGTITATDVDGDALAFTLAADGLPAHGSVALNPDGSYTYLPAPDWSGTDSFTVWISDGQGGGVAQVVTVAVSPVADAPHLTVATGTAILPDDHDALGAPTDDVIVAERGGDVVFGGVGNDTISGGTGLTTVFAGSGDDVIEDSSGRYATIVGGSGDDTIVTGQGSEVIHGDGIAGGVTVPLDISAGLTDTDGSEVLVAVTVGGLPDGAALIDSAGMAVGSLADGVWTLGPDQLDGLAIQLPDGAPTSFDLTIGAGAMETATGGMAWTETPVGIDLADISAVAGGADTILAGSGKDTVFGGDGDDVIMGEGGADTLYGGAGNDTILGGGQADVISGGAGDDLLMGGSHADTFLFEMGSGRDAVDGGDGNWTDTVDLSGLAEGTTIQIDLDDGRSWTGTTDEAEHAVDLGENVSGTISVEGSDDAIRFDNIEEVRW